MSARALALLGPAALAAFLGAAWLLVPRAERTAARETAVRVVLVDASASVRRTRPRWTAWARAELAREARAAEAAGELVCAVAFADDVAVRGAPEPGAAFLARLEGRGGEPPLDPAAGAGSDGATRLAAALESAARLAADPARAPGRVLVLGDGALGADDPSAALARLARAGVALELRAPPPAELPDLCLSDLVVPRAVEPGAPLVASVRVSWRPGAARAAAGARLSVVLEESGVRRALERPLALPAVAASWVEAVPLGPAALGRTALVVRAALEGDPDPVPENDPVEGAFRGEAARAVGVVAEPGSLAAARALLEPSGVPSLAGLDLVFLAPGEVGAALAGLDALVLHDLPPQRIGGELLEAFVRRGGGLGALVGWRFLADWLPGRAESAAERLLPLAPGAEEAPPREVVLLVDGSGSMAGAPFEMVRRAALALVGAALPSDRLALRFFTTGLEDELVLRERVAPGAPGGAADGEELAARLLAARVPRGQTMILRSLRQLAAEARAQEDEVLALLLSDGRERDVLARPLESAREVRGELAAARVRLVAVAVGDDDDAAFLGALLPEGEEVARARTLGELEAIFRRSVGGGRVREGAIGVRAASAAGALAREVQGAQDASLPPLARLARATPRPGAELVWESERGEPVLGVWRAGLGRAALFAALPGPSWAPEWGGRPGPGEPRALAPLVRWLARGEGARDEPPALVLGEDALELRGVAPGTPLLVRVRLCGTGDAPARAVELGPEGAPSGVLALDVRRGPALSDAERGAVAAALLELPGGGLEPLLLRRPPPAELLPPQDPDAGSLARRLAALADAGATARTPADPAQGPWGPVALVLGLGLLLAHVLAARDQAPRTDGR